MVKVIAIEPIEYHRHRVSLKDEKTGAEYEMIYGDSLSEKVIRMYAPLLVSKQFKKRR